MYASTRGQTPPTSPHRSVVARAPTRVDLGGGWTDVPPYSTDRGGAVCNFAIARYATVTLRSRSAASAPAPRTGRADDTAPTDALAAAAISAAGLEARELDVVIASDFPVGAGLGGSSAAGVALAGALAAWRGSSPTPAELAERSRTVEVEELGIAGGRQDHYAAAYGGAQLMEFGPGDGVASTRLPISASTVSALERRCIIGYTGEARVSGTTITGVMDAYRAGDAGVLTALARMHELAREMARALVDGELDRLAALMDEHWTHQRSLHPAIPTPAIDALLDAARRAGALGGKALGASGGGCVMVMAAAHAVDDVRRAVEARATLVPFSVDVDGFRVLSDG